MNRCVECRQSPAVGRKRCEAHLAKAIAYAREYRIGHRLSLAEKQRAYAERTGADRRSNVGRYDITLGLYDAMFESQGGLCKICGKPESLARNGKPLRLAIDHNHKTGKVRGLLCNNCNRAIGLLGDDVDTLHSAISYLEAA